MKKLRKILETLVRESPVHDGEYNVSSAKHRQEIWPDKGG